MSKTDSPDVLDFSQYLLSPTSRVEIDLPNGDPMMHGGARVAVNVYGPASAEHARAEAILTRAARDNIFRGKKGNSSDAEEEHESNVRFLAAVTASVENFPYPGGTEAMYRERRLGYIANQVRRHLGDLGNFYKPSKTS